MQFKYLTALLLVGACLAQVLLAQSNTDIQQKGLIDYLVNQSKESIEGFKNQTEDKYLYALTTFDELREQDIRIAKKAVASTEQLLNNVISDAQKEIQEIADNASELGIDISTCIDASEDQLKQVLSDFLNDEVQCAQNAVDIGFEIIDESITNVTKIYNESQVILDVKLENCGTELSSINCITGIFWEAKVLADQYTLNIDRQVAATANYVVELNIRLDVCANTQVAGAKIEAAKIVEEVSQCAAETQLILRI